MKKLFIKSLFALTIFAAVPARSLTIIPTFDNTIVTNVNAAAMMAGINGAIQVLQSNFTDSVTVNITFVADESVGLGQSATSGGDYSYADFLAALKSRAATAADTNALSKIPNAPTDPLIGGTQIHLTSAQARLLGLDLAAGTDSTISLKMSLMNFTRPPSDLGKYDLQQVVEHEVDEVLGISSGLPDTSIVWPVDLFRYTTNLIRTFTTNGDNAYFSPDGTNLLARYNMDPGGDYGDWWSFNFPTNWSPLTGDTLNFGQVQDAFSGPGLTIDLGVAEITALDIVGWTPATTATAARPILNIAKTSLGLATVSWPLSATGFVLQERTNLITGAWNNSLSGSLNPAIVSTTGGQKFYRLFSASGPAAAPAAAQTPSVLPAVAHNLTIRSVQPRKP